MTRHHFHFHIGHHSDENERKHRAQIQAIQDHRDAEKRYWTMWKEIHPMADRHLEPKKRPLRLLSLDGGGVRGIISLTILDRILHDIAPRTKPCDYFDLIGGTSTGGLIALMLGRLRMTIPQCIDAYCKLSQSIFDESILKMIPRLLKAHKFCHHKLEHAIQSVVAEHKGRTSTQMWDDPEDRQPGENICRTFVVAVPGCGVKGPPKLFRTYENQFQEERADKCEIWEAARATSCAPSFFHDVQVEGIHYSDGGLGYNNPTDLVLKEAQTLWGMNHEIGCLLSVGTGSKESFLHTFENITHLVSLVGIFQDIALNCETVHKRLEDNPFLTDYYFRFNPTLHESIGLAEWTKIKELKGIAWEYIAENADRIDALVASVRSKEFKIMAGQVEPSPIPPPPYKRVESSNSAFVGLPILPQA